eukprot:scaffold250_cov110-Isochrysis_galbana.AAC.12
MATRPPWKKASNKVASAKTRNDRLASSASSTKESLCTPQLTATVRSSDRGISSAVPAACERAAAALPKRSPKRAADAGRANSSSISLVPNTPGASVSKCEAPAGRVPNGKAVGEPRSETSSSAGACSRVRATALNVMTRAPVDAPRRRAVARGEDGVLGGVEEAHVDLPLLEEVLPPGRRLEGAGRFHGALVVRAELPPVAAARRLVDVSWEAAGRSQPRVRALRAGCRSGQREERRALALAQVGRFADGVPLARQQMGIRSSRVHHRVERPQPPLPCRGLPRRGRVTLRAFDDRVIARLTPVGEQVVACVVGRHCLREQSAGSARPPLGATAEPRVDLYDPRTLAARPRAVDDNR